VTVEATDGLAFGTGIEFAASDGSSLAVEGNVDVIASDNAVGIVSNQNDGQVILAVNGNLEVTSEEGEAAGISFDAGDQSKLDVSGDITVTGVDAIGIKIVDAEGDND